MFKKSFALFFCACISLMLCSQSFAHKRWILSSSNTLSSAEAEWVTFDYSASNDIFYFDHPMSPDDVVAFAPQGQTLDLQNIFTGKLRSVFDLEITDAGTYKIGTSGNPLYFGGYMPKGGNKPVRMRGKSAEELQSKFPKGVKSKITRVLGRIETYITKGEPTWTLLKPSGQGLELGEGFHPNEVYAGETNIIQLLLNGKPAKNIEVLITTEGSRFRDTLTSKTLRTDDEGKFSYDWPIAGRYLLEAEIEIENPKGSLVSHTLYGYFLTLESRLP